MIKIFKNKFLISVLVLVVTIIITSSCYADQDIIQIGSLSDYGYTLDEFINQAKYYSDNGYCDFDIISDNYFIYYSNNRIWALFWQPNNFEVDHFLLDGFGSGYRISAYNGSNCYSGSYKQILVYCYANSVNHQFNRQIDTYSGSYLSDVGGKSNWKLLASSKSVYYSDNNVSNVTIYSTVPSTSFDYSLTGIDYHSVRLDIENLNSYYNIFGYVGIENSYSVGDTLDYNSLFSNLRLINVNNDNSDTWCNLNIGETLTYYVVDDDYNICSIGVINELSVGDFLYGFYDSDHNSIDFVFVRNGVKFFNNTLDFYYKVTRGGNSSNFLHDDNMLDFDSYSTYIPEELYGNGSVTGRVVSSSNNDVLSEYTVNYSFDYSSDIKLSYDFKYRETGGLLNRYIFNLYNIKLTGTVSSGDSIDFSNYIVTWNFVGPTYDLEFNGNSTNISYGNFTFDRYGYSQEIQGIVASCYSSQYYTFNIFLEVYDNNGEFLFYKELHSNDLVSSYIANNSSNYGIIDNDYYNQGIGSSDFNNIQNWTIEDYSKLMSTDNTVWQFFKAILGNLPWWITTPLFILIFGVVIITIIRFARGA